MARKVEIDQEKILEAARKIIVEKGMDVKTSDVAKKAGVSEGSIFSRFKSKVGLIKEAVLSVFGKDWLVDIDTYNPNSDHEDVIKQALLEGLKFFRIVMPLHMAAVAHFGKSFSFPEMVKKRGIEAPPHKFSRKLKKYLDHLVEDKKIRECNTEVLSGLFLGGVMHRIFMEVSGTEKPTKKEDALFVEELYEIVTKGVKPIV